ncbi:MAG: hypothetical protein WCG27_06400 [Pseudomonadota bacterium]
MKQALIILIFLMPLSLYAGQVDFKVGEVEIGLETQNFLPQEVQGFLQCRLKDSTGLVESNPIVYLPTEVRPGPDATNPNFFSVKITGGGLYARKLFAQPRCCRYSVRVVSKNSTPSVSISGNFILAGSSFGMTEEEWEKLKDPFLNLKITQKYRRLKIVEKNDYLIEAN